MPLPSVMIPRWSGTQSGGHACATAASRDRRIMLTCSYSVTGPPAWTAVRLQKPSNKPNRTLVGAICRAPLGHAMVPVRYSAPLAPNIVAEAERKIALCSLERSRPESVAIALGVRSPFAREERERMGRSFMTFRMIIHYRCSAGAVRPFTINFSRCSGLQPGRHGRPSCKTF